MKFQITIILKILPAIGILILNGCYPDGQWQENDMPFEKAPVERAMPYDILEQNIFNTDYTAIVVIKKGRILEKRNWFFKDQGYVNHIYEADVLESIKGKIPNFITYSKMVEASTELSLPKYPLIVSLCASESEGNVFYLPDNGYETVASDSLVKFAKRVKDMQIEKSQSENVCK
jgi:hypothetical protein